MTAIDVVPTGNQRYQVDIEDADGSSQHEVDVPDELLERLDTSGTSMQEVVRAAVEFLIDREGRQQLGRGIDLGHVADRYEQFVEVVPDQARARTAQDAPPPGEQTGDRDDRTSDERLVDEVRQEQADGLRSSQEPRL